MDGLGTGLPSRFDELEVVGVRLRLAQQHGLVGLRRVRGPVVRVGVHRDRPDAEPLALLHDVQTTGARVGDQHGVEHTGDTSQVTVAVVALLGAVLVGLLTGGSLERLGRLPLRFRGLVYGAFGAQLVGSVVGGPLYPVGLAVSAGLVTWFLARNRGIRGTGLLAVGLLSNALVVAANGAMPVSVEAAGRAGTTTQRILTGEDARHEIADRHTRLPWLGDVIPVPAPWRPEVISPGDVAVAAGLGQLVLLGMRSGVPFRRRHARRVQPLSQSQSK